MVDVTFWAGFGLGAVLSVGVGLIAAGWLGLFDD